MNTSLQRLAPVPSEWGYSVNPHGVQGATMAVPFGPHSSLSLSPGSSGSFCFLVQSLVLSKIAVVTCYCQWFIIP